MIRVAFAVLLAATFVHAQVGNEGSIEGSVTDTTGAVVPGAIVDLRESATGFSAATSTDHEGIYRFLILPLGTYELEVTKSGFAPWRTEHINVTAGAKLQFSVRLSVSATSENLTVDDSPPLLELSRSSIATTVDSRLLRDLPINGRNFTDIVALVPGATRGPGGGARFGGMNFGSGILTDGANNNNPLSGQNFSAIPFQFSLAAVREFQVDVHGYPAGFGRAETALVNAVTRTGTNELHGGLFWFFRDKGLNAADPVRKMNGLPREPLHVHQFGADLSGPVRRDRVFFSAAYEGQRHNLENATVLGLPSDFQISTNAATAVLQQRALDYLRPRALPFRQTDDEDSAFARLDGRFSTSHSWTVRWNSARVTGLNGSNSGPQNSREHTGTAHTNNDALAVSWTSVISANSVNVARVGYLHNANRADANSVNSRASVFEGGQLVLTIGHPVNAPQKNVFHQAQWSDTVSLSRGRHNLRFGVEGILTNVTNLSVRNFFGNYRFNSLASFGRSLSGVAGLQSGESYIQGFSGTGEPGIISHPDSHDFDGFVQDDWRLRRGLTLNLGLRYDVQWMAQPAVSNPAAPLSSNHLDTAFMPLDLTKISPRIGLAWAPFASERLILRSGYGIFSGWLPANLAVRAFVQNGISIQTRTFTPGNATAAFIPAYPNTVCGVTTPDGTPPDCPAPVVGTDTLMLVARDYVQPYSQHANLGVEFAGQKVLTFSATYLMVKGTHLPRWRDVNLRAPSPAVIGIAGSDAKVVFNRYSSSRPIGGFDRIFALESNGNSSYHGLVVQANRRVDHGFQLLAGYTFSKVIDDHPESIGFDPGTSTEALLISDPYHPRNDRGLGVADATHRFVLSGTWQLPGRDLASRMMRMLLSDWQTSGVIAVQSGLPYTSLVSADLNNDGNALTDRSPGRSRSSFRAPLNASWDHRITKTIRVRDRLRLQVLAEAFNLLNRANYTDPRTIEFTRSTNAGVCGIAGTPCLVPQRTSLTAFGTPTGSTGPRVVQGALKLVF